MYVYNSYIFLFFFHYYSMYISIAIPFLFFDQKRIKTKRCVIRNTVSLVRVNVTNFTNQC